VDGIHPRGQAPRHYPSLSVEERRESIKKFIPDSKNTILIDGRNISSEDNFYNSIVSSSGIIEDNREEKSYTPTESRRVLAQSNSNLIIIEFDSMNKNVQRTVAQTIKMFAETKDWKGYIGYTCQEGDAVVRANPDLSMRVKSWELK